MNNPNGSDILKNLMDKAKMSGSNPDTLNENELMKKISKTDKKKASDKLRSMGLGVIADKLNSMSDNELMDIIKKNPGILKKAKDFIK